MGTTQSRLKVSSSSGLVPARAHLNLARAFNIELEGAKHLLQTDGVLPCPLETKTATKLAEALRQDGVSADVVETPTANMRCPAHPSLVPDTSCERCEASVCELCRWKARASLCHECCAKKLTTERRVKLRVGFLLILLAATSVWVRRTVEGRKARTQWIRTLEVAIVPISESGLMRTDVRRAWNDGVPQLEQWMQKEFERHTGNTFPPVHFRLMQPLELSSVPGVGQMPELRPSGESWSERAQHAFRMWRFWRAVNSEAGVTGSGYDARIYVHLKPKDAVNEKVVEGVAEEGGELGVVRAPLDEEEITLSLVAIAHELFHCLGAKDKYDANGHAMLPDGLADPEQTPMYPQKKAEVMVGERPMGKDDGLVPTSLNEVAVGPVTAMEIRWR